MAVHLPFSRLQRFATPTQADGCTALPWACELYLLVELLLEDGEAYGFSHPADIAAMLPGWVEYGNQSYNLLYVVRFDHCVHCKNQVNNQSRHTYRECTVHICSYFGNPGHPRRTCPKAKTAAAASKEARKQKQLEDDFKTLLAEAKSRPAKHPLLESDAMNMS